MTSTTIKCDNDLNKSKSSVWRSGSRPAAMLYPGTPVDYCALDLDRSEDNLRKLRPTFSVPLLRRHGIFRVDVTMLSLFGIVARNYKNIFNVDREVRQYNS